LGFDKDALQKGLYGFNSLLVGLGLAIFYAPNFPFFILLTVAALITILITIASGGILGKYGLPFLSIPFIFSLWTVTLAARGFTALGISERGVYVLNELYATGSSWLVNSYQFFNELALPEPVSIYLKSLGAIFFQFNLLSGLLIAIGLLIFSRIAFSLSLISFLAAYYFYEFLGADISVLSYNYIGFNFILTGIAIGGYYLVPSRSSYLWTLILIPAVVLVTTSSYSILQNWQLGIYSLPFNVVVISFLYVLKLRYNPELPEEVAFQEYSPEKNLYKRLSNGKRYHNFRQVAIGLPVFGEWFINQAHDGEITHRGEWRHAWDFVIMDDDAKEYTHDGNRCEDYYCYSKPVVAPAAGTVEQVVDTVEDNFIGASNLAENWGNTIVLKHANQLYSQMSHLRKGSVKVKPGDYVKKGEVIANCGNSGRSPYPHLHFQMQTTPFIGSKTLFYPLSHYLSQNGKPEFHFFGFPGMGQLVSNALTNSMLEKAFDFLPGQQLHFNYPDGREDIWEVKTDFYNNTYLECGHGKSQAYFVNDGTLFYFINFTGKKSTLLYQFYRAAYKVLLQNDDRIKITDEYPLDHLYSGWKRILQDFIAPFYRFLTAQYQLRYQSEGNLMSPDSIMLQSISQILLLNKRIIRQSNFLLKIDEKGIEKFVIFENNKPLEIKCLR
jgi:urea transporter